jgi:hypothetical protein
MQRFIRVITAFCLAALWAMTAGGADEPAQPGHGRLDDPLLQNLVGKWKVTRKIRETVVGNTLEADWVLQHQFVQMHMKDAAEPPAYEALVLIGFDSSTQRYVAHWCDNFGAQYSGVGYGKRTGNMIEFVFDYPDGPFYNRFSWNPEAGAWTLLMESEGKDGKRTFFAEDTVRRQ